MTKIRKFIPYIIAVIAGLVALFFKNKAEQSSADALIAKVEAKDAPLAARQAEDQAKIKAVDADIEAMKEERKKLRDEYLTDQERANKWNKSKQ